MDEDIIIIAKISLLLRESQELPPPSNQPYQRPVGTTDVFVDDFIQMGQGSISCLQNLHRHLLHAVDQVLSHPGLDEQYQ